MEKIERFLSDYSWLLKSGIWLALVLWAAQFSWVISEIYKEESWKVERKLELEEKFSIEYHKIYKRLLKEAKAKGEFYGPKDYFDDYKEIKILQNEIGIEYDSEPFMLSDIGELNLLMRGNIGEGRKYSWDDVSSESRKLHEWLNRGGAAGDEFYADLDKLPWSYKLGKIWSWFSSLYCRGFFLVIFLYLIRMSEREGVLRIFFSEKKRFFLAIILWPVMVFKYPFNIFREIITEAEYRRRKEKLFSFLSGEEKRLIREVSRNCLFKKQQFGFFELKPVHSFAGALVVTLFFAVLPYSNKVEARPLYDCNQISVSHEEFSDHLARMEIDEDDELSSSFGGFSVDCLVGTFIQEYFPLVARFFCLMRKFHLQEVFRKIAHIPLYGCLNLVSNYYECTI